MLAHQQPSSQQDELYFKPWLWTGPSRCSIRLHSFLHVYEVKVDPFYMLGMIELEEDLGRRAALVCATSFFHIRFLVPLVKGHSMNACVNWHTLWIYTSKEQMCHSDMTWSASFRNLLTLQHHTSSQDLYKNSLSRNMSVGGYSTV